MTEDQTALRRLMVAGSKVSHMVAQYKSASVAKDANEDTRQHEQTEHSQKAFVDNLKKLYTVMKDMGNPFGRDWGYFYTGYKMYCPS